MTVSSFQLSIDNLLQRQKYFILELREHYDSFLERREYTIKVPALRFTVRLLECLAFFILVSERCQVESEAAVDGPKDGGAVSR